MPTTRATGDRDPRNRRVRGFMTRHNRGVGIMFANVMSGRLPSLEKTGYSVILRMARRQALRCTA